MELEVGMRTRKIQNLKNIQKILNYATNIKFFKKNCINNLVRSRRNYIDGIKL